MITLETYFDYVILPILAISVMLVFIRLFRGPAVVDRVIALDLIITIGIGIITVYSIRTDQKVLLDVAIILGLKKYLGFMLGFFVLWIMNRTEEDQRYFYRVPKVISFIFYFLYELIKSNVQVAFDVITPRYFFRPGIVSYPMNADTDFEINLLTTMISLTPGTLIIDISEDKKTIYIHVMYLTDPETFVRETKNGLERRLLEILR